MCATGVAWDPLNQFIATQSSDRSCRIYTSGQNPKREIFGPIQKGKWANVKCKRVLRTRSGPHISSRSKRRSTGAKPNSKPSDEASADSENNKAIEVNDSCTPKDPDTPADPRTPTDPGTPKTSSMQAAEAASNDEVEASVDKKSDKKSSDTKPSSPSQTSAASQNHVMFMDETVPNFFRRLCFSPDGEYLLTPTGCFRSLEADSSVQQVCKILMNMLSVCFPRLYFFSCL